MAVPPFLIGVAGDADEGAGVVDGFALGEEAEEVALALLAFGFARIGPGGEWEGFLFGGFHVFRSLAGRFGCRDTLRAVRKALYG